MDVKELLQRFLDLQQRRALVYSDLHKGFANYLISKSEMEYKELCSRMTMEFNECSQEVIKIEIELRDPRINREDLANLLQTLQTHEKTKLQMTATLQVLKRVGHPNERYLEQHGACSGHANCGEPSSSGLEECEAEAEYLAAHKEAINSLQEAVVAINDLVETLRLEVEDL